MITSQDIRDAAEELGELVVRKNAAYGSAFEVSADFLKLLYPNCIEPHEYGNMLLLVRIFDKMMRIATDNDNMGEDPFGDIAGYGLIAQASNRASSTL